VELSLKDAVIQEGTGRVLLGHLAGTGPFLEEVGPSTAVIEWVVRAEGAPAFLQIIASSAKAGVVRSEWIELSPQNQGG
jgi:hypothetical protein